MKTLNLVHLDGRTFATAHFTNWGANRWPWVQETVAREFDCDCDDVTAEADEDNEFVAVAGVRVARIG